MLSRTAVTLLEAGRSLGDLSLLLLFNPRPEETPSSNNPTYYVGNYVGIEATNSLPGRGNYFASFLSNIYILWNLRSVRMVWLRLIGISILRIMGIPRYIGSLGSGNRPIGLCPARCPRMLVFFSHFRIFSPLLYHRCHTDSVCQALIEYITQKEHVESSTLSRWCSCGWTKTYVTFEKNRPA